MELIFWGVSRGEIEPRYTSGGVFISELQILAATANPIVQIPPFDELTQRMMEVSFLQDCEDPTLRKESGWFIPQMVWDLNASLMQVSK